MFIIKRNCNGFFLFFVLLLFFSVSIDRHA